MADYIVHALAASQVSITGGESLSGITQGDGSNLVGQFITIGNGPLTDLNVSDAGSDSDFDDNDGNQRLNGAQSFDGTTYADGTRIEAEYSITLRDNSTGQTYQVLGVNINNSSPSFGTTEGVAFVGSFPPRGVPLEVISSAEGPGSSGQPPVDESSLVPCFTGSTLISTTTGPERVEQITLSDLVLTRQHGPQPVRWIGRRRVAESELHANPKLYPVRILAGSLGNGFPQRDLLISRQHRMLVRSSIAERMFGVPEVLVPAIKLTSLPGVYVDKTVQEVEYFHLLFDRHEIIFAEGAPSESLFTGAEALKAISAEAREEIFVLFPELKQTDVLPEPAGFIPTGKQQRKLIDRHVKNEKPLVSLADIAL
ncbi:Hint domain-containing protein [Ruegeria sp. HKCCD7318]|uniref:Hint domain-containing protein n=1 Tax=Ruegeria sp. HKCCD7318 TaxID=2683014 RepID=UPI0014911E60|nr:Hint domain-containing protein [Ruegeria sp. HKCCD7318]NOE35750.1 calcium-binding protein [Ruegeria sp. HKCCD7318]